MLVGVTGALCLVKVGLRALGVPCVLLRLADIVAVVSSRFYGRPTLCAMCGLMK